MKRYEGLGFLRLLPRLARAPLETIVSLAQKNAGMMLFRLGKHRTFLLNTPEEIREVLHDDQTRFDRAEVLTDLKPLVGQGLFSSPQETWVQRRRLMNPAFRPDGDQALVGATTAAVNRLFERIDADDGPVDFELEIKRACLETLLDFHFAPDLPVVHDSLIGALDRILQFASLEGHLKRVARRPWATLNSHQTQLPADTARALKFVDEFLSRTIEIASTRTTTDESPRVGRALRDLLHARDSNLIDDTGIRDELATLLFAGFDTVAEMVTWALHLVAIHPDVQATVRADLQEERPILDGMRVHPDGHEVDILQLILFEALRLYPPAWALFRTPIGPATIAGEAIAPRSAIMACPFSMQRNPRVWVEPEAFRPERHRARAEPGTYIPFGFGQHTCIGRRMALIEGRVILAGLLRRYRVTAEHSSEPRIRPGIIIQAAEPLRFRFDRLLAST